LSAWHFIIPFYFGKNKFVMLKGGAPIGRKIYYLQRTIDSILSLGKDARITIFTCDAQSKEQALLVHPSVQMIDCPAKHLPLQTVTRFQAWFREYGANDDIVAFTEDDQVLYLADSVKKDIQDATERVVFSPHRWSRQFFFFRAKGRPMFRLNGCRGLLDNFDAEMKGREFQFNHRYRAQTNKGLAYAACWFMKGLLFKAIDFARTDDKVELESASYIIYKSGIPVIKLSADAQQAFSDFLADHLSGYDYNRRLFKL
jgi:hypothetical protein